MDQFGLDGVVASTPENVLYLSGFSSWRQRNYRHGNSQVCVVLPRDQGCPPALLISDGDDAYASHQDIWVKEICTYGGEAKPRLLEGTELTPEERRFIAISGTAPKGHRYDEALAQVIREKGLGKSRIGIDQIDLPEGAMERLGTLLPGVKLFRASNFFLNVRMISTDAEVERLRQAATLNRNAAMAVLQTASQETSEGALASVYGREIAQAGGQVCWLHLAAGRGGNFPPLKDHILKEGEILRMDMGCRLNGYNADTCRSGCIGIPSDKQRVVFDALQAGVLKAIENLKPGALASELLEATVRTIRTAGLPGFTRNFVGHMIGLEARGFPFSLGPVKDLDDPFFPATSDVPMEQGMVVNLEASNHEPGWGSVSVEYSLLVTEKGCEHLIPPDQRLYSLPLY